MGAENDSTGDPLMNVRLRKVIQDGQHARLESNQDDLLLYLVESVNKNEKRILDFSKRAEWRVWGIHKMIPKPPHSHSGSYAIHGARFPNTKEAR